MATPTVRSNLDMESYSLRNMYLSVFVVKSMQTYIGMTLAWTSILIPYLERNQQISTVGQAAVLASLPLGMAMGPIIGSVLTPRYGFKSIFLQFACLSLASVLLLAFQQLLVVCVARLAAGVAIGAFLCYGEAYLQDIADDEVTILLNPSSIVFLSLGFYLVYEVGQILLYFQMLMILLVFPSLFLGCMLWLPESPYVQVAAGKLENVRKSVDFLHRGISTRGLDQLINLIQDAARRRETDGEIFIPLYSKEPKIARVSLVFLTLLPLSGFPVVFMLMEPLISIAQQQLSVGSSLSAVARLGLSPAALAWTLNAYCSSRLKLMVSSAVMAVSMASLGIYFFYLESAQHEFEVNWVPFISIALYTIAFLVGFVHISSRSSRITLCGRVLTLSCGFLSMTLVILLFYCIKALLGTAVILWTFSAVSILLTVFIYIYSPNATFF